MSDREQLEQLVRNAFCWVLGVEHVELDDDFFLLGGNSFLVVRLVQRMRGAGLDLDYVVVFTGRSVRGIVDQLRAVAGAS
ncbi:phosphopantetheine-binding protein [Lentzea alba]|uniref:phosphopantetheine-binding protein n=1 Tax=Lentzea alba TaxID=2714351 RepID=UPI0039BFD039